MVEEFGSPSSYIQGKGVLFESPKCQFKLEKK